MSNLDKLVKESSIIQEKFNSMGVEILDSKEKNTQAINCLVAFLHRGIDIMRAIDTERGLTKAQKGRKAELNVKVIKEAYEFKKITKEDYIYFIIALESREGNVLSHRFNRLIGYRSSENISAMTRTGLLNRLKYRPNMSLEEIIETYNI